MEKIRILKGSLRCFVLGWFSLVPLLGLPAALFILITYFRLPRAARTPANVAHPYLACGLVLALIGLGISLLLGFVVAAVAIMEMSE